MQSTNITNNNNSNHNIGKHDGLKNMMHLVQHLQMCLHIILGKKKNAIGCHKETQNNYLAESANVYRNIHIISIFLHQTECMNTKA